MINLDLLLTAGETTLKSSSDYTPMIVFRHLDEEGEEKERIVIFPDMGKPGTERMLMHWLLGRQIADVVPALQEIALGSDTWVTVAKDREAAKNYIPGTAADQPDAREALMFIAFNPHTGKVRALHRTYSRDVTLERTKIKFDKITRGEDDMVPYLLLYIWAGYQGMSFEEAEDYTHQWAEEFMARKDKEKEDKHDPD